MNDAGGNAEFVLVPGADRAGPEFDTPEVHEKVVEFRNKYLM